MFFGILEDNLDPQRLIGSMLDPLFDDLMKSYLTMLDNFEGFTDDFANMLKEVPSFLVGMYEDLVRLIPMMIDSVVEAFGFDRFAVRLYDGLIDAIHIAFNAMIDAVNTILGIASPSKVFTEIGSNIITSLVDTKSNLEPVGGILDKTIECNSISFSSTTITEYLFLIVL